MAFAVARNWIPRVFDGFEIRQTAPECNSGVHFRNAIPGDISGMQFRATFPECNSGGHFRNAIPGYISGMQFRGTEQNEQTFVFL